MAKLLAILKTTSLFPTFAPILKRFGLQIETAVARTTSWFLRQTNIAQAGTVNNLAQIPAGDRQPSA